MSSAFPWTLRWRDEHGNEHREGEFDSPHFAISAALGKSITTHAVVDVVRADGSVFVSVPPPEQDLRQTVTRNFPPKA